MKTATLRLFVCATVAAASVAVAFTTLRADTMTCDLSQYKAGAGPTVSMDQNALTVSWPGQSGSEMRTRYAIDGGQPIEPMTALKVFRTERDIATVNGFCIGSKSGPCRARLSV